MKSIDKMKTKQNIIEKLSTLGLAFAIAALITTPAQAQGKAEAAKAALEAAVELGPKLHKLIAGYDRSAEITIRNHSNLKLKNIKTYTDSGKVLGLDLGKEIPAKGSGGVVARKADGAARGAVGLVSWDIEGTDRKLIIMYSVPYDYNLYSNYYNCEVAFTGSPINKDRFDSLYDADDVKKAGSNNTWHDAGGTLQDQAAFMAGAKRAKFRWQMTGTMEDSGNAKIVIDFHDLGE